MKKKRQDGSIFSLQDGFRCEGVPSNPGVYLFRAEDDTPLYIGKAKRLRHRLLSYFRPLDALPARTRLMVQKASFLEVILTRTEKEALILEAELIGKHKPRYNVRLRDDKSYPFLRLGIKSEFPRLSVVRKRRRDGALYFGPYTSGQALRQTLRIIFTIFRLRSCSDRAMKGRSRPCLKYQIQRCSGPCTGAISTQDYMADVHKVKAFLEGRASFVKRQIKQAMEEAASRLEFEKAALYRDQLKALEGVLERQAVVLSSVPDMDVIYIARDEDIAQAVVLKVREGIISSKHPLRLEVNMAEGDRALYSNFLKIYYSSSAPPRQVIVPVSLREQVELEYLLSHFGQKRVSIRTVQHGKRKELLDIAKLNAHQAIADQKARHAKWLALTKILEKRLELRRLPNSVEGIDISNTSGDLPVGSLVSFYMGSPRKAGYRHYFLNTPGIDDYAMIREVMARRLKRAQRKRDLPDLFIIDGGKGQLMSAVKVLREQGMEEQVDIVSIAKERGDEGDKIFLCGHNDSLKLGPSDPVLLFCQRVRDEAHRFGVKTHRARRSKRMLDSGLLKIPGVGKARQAALLNHFGSLESLSQATVEEIRAVPGLPEKVCRNILDYFEKKEDRSGKD